MLSTNCVNVYCTFATLGLNGAAFCNPTSSDNIPGMSPTEDGTFVGCDWKSSMSTVTVASKLGLLAPIRPNVSKGRIQYMVPQQHKVRDYCSTIDRHNDGLWSGLDD